MKRLAWDACVPGVREYNAPMSHDWIWRALLLFDDPKPALWAGCPLWWRIARLLWCIVLAVTGQLVLVERTPIVVRRRLRRSIPGYRSPFARSMFSASSALRAPPV